MNKGLHRVRKILLLRVAPALIVLALLAIVAAGFWPYRLPALSRIVRHELSRTGADSLALAGVSVTPWRGATVDSLYLRFAFRDGRHAEFFFEHLKISYHPFSLFFGGKHLRFSLQTAAAKARAAGDPAVAAGILLGILNNRSFTSVVKTVAASNGWCRLAAPDRRPVVELRDLTETIEVTDPDSVSAEGSMNAGTLCFNGRYYLIRPSATLRIEQGRLALSKIKAFYCEGTLRGSATFDVPAARLSQAEFKLTGMSIEKWYETQRNTAGALKGTANITFTADTCRLGLDSIRGGGECRVKDLVANDLPIQRNLIALLPIPQLRHVEFGTIGTSFELGGGRLSMPDLKGTGDPMDIIAIGWVSLVDGTFSDSVNCLLTKKFSRSLPDVARESLLPHDNGRLGFECSMSGTMANPSLVLNKQILERAVKNVFEKLGNELKDFFR